MILRHLRRRARRRGGETPEGRCHLLDPTCRGPAPVRGWPRGLDVSRAPARFHLRARGRALRVRVRGRQDHGLCAPRLREAIAADRAPPGGVRGEATALPFPDESFDGVAILYVLYHLAEAHRVMRQGGLIAVTAPSRHDSPELVHALPKTPLTFDAELAPGLLRELFEEPEVKRWDAPLLVLPTARAVRDYLIGKQVAPDRAQAVAAAVELPLLVTKRGALLLARKMS